MNEVNSPAEQPPQKGPPWLDPELQKDVEWRDGDIIVSVPAKSGTTWMMNIIHQLRTGGDPDFRDIYIEVPWLEFVNNPQDTREKRLDRFRSQSTSRRRVFKTHSAPPMLPYVEPGSNTPDVKYVVVLRNPEEAIVSFKLFMEGHRKEFFDLWQVPKDIMIRPTFAEYYHEVLPNMPIHMLFFMFLNDWWPLRSKPNVYMVHFSELKRTPERIIRELAKFVGLSPTEEQWPNILEYSSFDWMKKHEAKFESQEVVGFPLLEPGAMVRKGKVGAAHEDGMTEEISKEMRARGAEIIKDPKILDWFYRGGPLPQD